MPYKREGLRIQDNLYVRTKRGDKIVDERKKHNVFTYNGRIWLSKLIGSAAYPALTSVANMRDTDLPTDDGAGVDYALDTSWDTGNARTYRVRWVAVGTGGVLQSIGPQGGNVEVPSIAGVESPSIVKVSTVGASNEEWMKQALPQSYPADFPDQGTIVFHTLFAETDVSFVHPSNPTYGTSVPVSEVALFTSAADPFLSPDVVTHAGDVPGMIAYGLLAPIVKTPNVELEVIWEITFK